MCHNAYIKESTCRKRKRDRMIQKKTETPKDQNHWSHSPSSVLHTRDTAAAAAEKKQHQQRHQTFRKAKLQTDRSMMMWWYNLHKHVRPYTQRASRAHIDSCEERVFLSRQKKQINLSRICEISKYKKYCSTRVTRLTHLVPKELFCYLFVEFSLNFEYFGSRGQPHQPMMQLSDALKWHIFEPLWVMISSHGSVQKIESLSWSSEEFPKFSWIQNQTIVGLYSGCVPIVAIWLQSIGDPHWATIKILSLFMG